MSNTLLKIKLRFNSILNKVKIFNISAIHKLINISISLRRQTRKVVGFLISKYYPNKKSPSIKAQRWFIRINLVVQRLIFKPRRLLYSALQILLRLKIFRLRHTATWVMLFLLNILNCVLYLMSRPIRILVRIFFLNCAVFKAILILTVRDISCLWTLSVKCLPSELKKSFPIVLFLATSAVTFLPQIPLGISDGWLTGTYSILNSIQAYEYVCILKCAVGTEVLNSGLFKSLSILVIAAHYGSSYFSAVAAKRPIFSTYYLLIYIGMVTLWAMPEYAIFKILYIYMGLFLAILLLIVKGLREDARIINDFPVDPFSSRINPYSFITGKHHSIIYSISPKIHSPVLEFIKFLIISITVCSIVLDSREFQLLVDSGVWAVTMITPITALFYTILLTSRQSSYPVTLWLLYFSYSIFWTVFGSFLLFSNDFNYFGLVSQNTINETTAISSMGLIGSFGGLEQVMLNMPGWQNSWFYGEGFSSSLRKLNMIEKFDNLQFVLEPYKMGGDMYIPPHMLTPSDDHNWTINTTFENTYFQSVRTSITKSDSLQGDTLRYWPIERNLHIWFGEFLEKDLYYGWSNRTLMDTENFFDTSPYALSNIFGDNITSKFLIEVLNIFVGAREYDTGDEYSLDDWGQSYGPGASLREHFTQSLEPKRTTLDVNQKSRVNDENYHEWFPGIYVLDGKFDVKKPIVHLRFFLILFLSITLYWLWSSLNDLPQLNILETLGERDIAIDNFFLFGNGQSETISSFAWSKIFTSSFEWPVEPYIDDNTPFDDLDLIPSEEMFTALTPNNDDSSLLDSYYYIPIFKAVEGYSAFDYKHYLMPIFFPMSGKSLWASNVAREINFEYSTLFETFYNNGVMFGDFWPKPSVEYDGTEVSGSDDSSTGETNKTESNDMLDDTLIDEPATETQAEWTDPDFNIEEYYYSDYLAGRIDSNIEDQVTVNLDYLWTTQKIREKLNEYFGDSDSDDCTEVENDVEKSKLVGVERKQKLLYWRFKFRNPKLKETDWRATRMFPTFRFSNMDSLRKVTPVYKHKQSMGLVKFKEDLKLENKLSTPVSQQGILEKQVTIMKHSHTPPSVIDFPFKVLGENFSRNEEKINLLQNERKQEVNNIAWPYSSSLDNCSQGYKIRKKLQNSDISPYYSVNYGFDKIKITAPLDKVYVLNRLFEEEISKYDLDKYGSLDDMGLPDSFRIYRLLRNKIVETNKIKFKNIHIIEGLWDQRSIKKVSIKKNYSLRLLLKGNNTPFRLPPHLYLRTLYYWKKFVPSFFLRKLEYRFNRKKGIFKKYSDLSRLPVSGLKYWFYKYLDSCIIDLKIIDRVNNKFFNPIGLFVHQLILGNMSIGLDKFPPSVGEMYPDKSEKIPTNGPAPTVRLSALYNYFFKVAADSVHIKEKDLVISVGSRAHQNIFSEFYYTPQIPTTPLDVDREKYIFRKKGISLPAIKEFRYPTIKKSGNLTIFIISASEGRFLINNGEYGYGEMVVYVDRRYLPAIIKFNIMWDYRNPWVKNLHVFSWKRAIGFEERLGLPYYKKENLEVGKMFKLKKSWIESLAIVRKIKDFENNPEKGLKKNDEQKIDDDETTTESSSSTEDSSSSEDTDADDTYNDQWEGYIDERHGAMNGEEAETLEIAEYLEFLPFFAQGYWDGSDSEGTVVERNSSTLWVPPRRYKIFSGVFILNNHMFEGILQLLPHSKKMLTYFEKYINPFVSDDETSFYDDKVVTFRNLPLMWIEFARHIYISRWRLQYNYSNTNKTNDLKRYPSAFLHEYYNFKYKVYGKFIRSVLEDSYYSQPVLNNVRRAENKKNLSKWSSIKKIVKKKKLLKPEVSQNTTKKYKLTPNMGGRLRASIRRIVEGRIRYVRHRFTHKMKETTGLVSYKRPYRIPVVLEDEATKKEMSINTKNAWYIFIFMIDMFDEEEIEDEKFKKLNSEKRMDANLRYKRNWFFSNFMLEDKELMDTKNAYWANLTDFDQDRRRSKFRNLKHGGQYRLNFNSELWWTKWDRADHGFRRIDDLQEGILDFYGPANHLHGGLENMMFLDEDEEIFETTLPLFEKSLLDPESPALNEDGEFAEFDENVVYGVEYLGGNIPDHLVVSDIENFNMWDEAKLISESIKKMKKKGFGSILNNSNITTEKDFNPVDFGDIVDILSNKTVHPISYAADFIFDDNIDQKLEEALLHYALTGISYDTMFYDHNDMVEEKLVLSWDDLDILRENSLDEDENPIGIGYDLLLVKWGKQNYWSTILEMDSNWEDLYQSVYPQIHDSVENMHEYLPVWNFDPALWEYTGHDYDAVPLVIEDDSKLLINTKINRFDSQYNWLSSKSLTQKEVSLHNNNWGGADPLTGFNDQIEFDFFYDDEDVDTDVDIDVENLYLIPDSVVQNKFEDEDDSEEGVDRISESVLLDYYNDTAEPNEDEKDVDDLATTLSKELLYSSNQSKSTSVLDEGFHIPKSEEVSEIYREYNDDEWQDYCDSDDTTSGGEFIEDDSRGALTSDDEEDEFYFDTADPDEWDVSIHFLDGQEEAEYTFADWGQENDDPDGETDDSDTINVQNYPSTEEVYQDYMENDYAVLGREYPEEVNFMLQDDDYDELISELELTDLPDSIEFSELESVDSEFSISQFDESILVQDSDSTANYTTIEVTAESSTDVASQESNDNLGLIEVMDGEGAEIGWRANYESPIANPEIDIIDPPPGLSNRPKLEFEDHMTSMEYQAEKMSEIFMKDWNDSSPIELEDTTRETESYGSYQKYIDSYRIESLLDEILFIKYRRRSLGLKFNISQILVENGRFWQISFKEVLFKRTNYLATYRALMEDLNLGAYSF